MPALMEPDFSGCIDSFASTDLVSNNHQSTRYNIKYLIELDIQVDFRDTSSHKKEILIPRSGDEWLDQVLNYLQGNLDYLLDYFAKKITRIKVIPPQGTYLIWLDFNGLGMDDLELRHFMREKARVGLDDGFLFGKAGSGFQRMNIACPRYILTEALTRIEMAVNGL